MNIFTKLTLTVALLGSLTSVKAQSVVEIHAPGDGEVSTVPLSLQTKISFSQTGIEIANEGAAPAIFPFATTAKITFKTDGNSVASIMGATSFRCAAASWSRPSRSTAMTALRHASPSPRSPGTGCSLSGSGTAKAST